MLEEGEIFLEQVQQQLKWQAQVTRNAKELRPLTDVLLKQGAGAAEQLPADVVDGGGKVARCLAHRSLLVGCGPDRAGLGERSGVARINCGCADETAVLVTPGTGVDDFSRAAMDKTLAEHGLGHKSVIRFRTPGLTGLSGSCF